MNVARAEFVMSNTRVDHCPKTKMPEYAFIGRSNVGKSSLINMLCNQKKTSQNFFTTRKNTIDQSFFNQQEMVFGRFTRLWLCQSF
jgi:GTP-binding protein